MKWVIIGAVVLIVLFVAFCVYVDRSTKIKKPGICSVRTSNGAILICYCFDQRNYEVVGIKRQRKHIIIPDTVDGKHKITALNFFDGEYVSSYKRVRHIHLPASMEDISEDAWGDNFQISYRMNAFCSFPNLKSITVDEQNPVFTARGGMIYKNGTKLMAAAPGILGTVTIEKGVNKIAKSALLDLKKVTSFSVEEDNPCYKSVDGVLYTKSGKKLLQYPILKIGAKFSVPEGVKKIRAEAFFNQRYVQMVEMPESLRTIGRAAFAGARMLRNVKLNEKLRVMEEDAFAYTRVRQLTLPKSLRTAEIGSLPVKELVIPKKLGDISVAHRDGEGILRASKLYIENPALNLNAIENFEGNSIFSSMEIHAYEGSLPYRQIKEVADQYLIDLVAIPGKRYDAPPEHWGPVDTSWYSDEKEEFFISTPEQFAGLSKLAKDGEWFSGQTFYLKCDLDMRQYANFQPVQEFDGVFDGQGNRIYNLHIYRLEDNVGLFSELEEEGMIKNLCVSGEVTGGNCTGGIVGASEGMVENCTFKGKVKGYGYSGKIIGFDFEQDYWHRL